MNIYNIWIMIQGKVAGLFKPTETAYDAEFAKKRIDELYVERLHHEAMAFRYYRAMTSNSKGIRRQAAKIKRLEAHISDIEFINKYLELGVKDVKR